MSTPSTNILVNIILIALALFSTSVSCLDLESQIKIDQIINENFLPNNKIPGLGLSIVSENGSVWSKGYGLRDVENSINATGDTKFCIASITKSFTAVLVVKTLSELYPEKGGSVLDIPIRKLHPASNFTLVDRFRSGSTTFRDMLAHRTCLSNEFWGLIVSGSFKDTNELIFRQRFAPEVCSFRSDFVYNNGIYAHAGELIAAIANLTLIDMFLKLFEDIGMSSSRIIQPSDDYDKMPNMSRAYYRKNGQTHPFNTELLKKNKIDTAAGAILSTPNDMAKYLLFHLNKGKVGSKQIVSEEAMSWITEPAVPLKSSWIKFRAHKDDVISGYYSYGLGVVLGIYDGWEMVSHSGYISPFLSFMSFYPALKIGVFTASNGPGSLDDSNDHGTLHRQIFEILAGSNITTNVRDKTASNASDVDEVGMARQKYLDNITSMADQNYEIRLENMTGIFGNPQSGDILVTIVNGTGNDTARLYFRAGEWSTGWLNKLPGSNTTYSLEWDSDVVHEMYADGDLQEFLLDFSDINKPVAFYLGITIVFERDLTIDKLPNQTWGPESCGPEPNKYNP